MNIEIIPGVALAQRVANIICDVVRAKPDAVLGLPTGATPIDTYAELARRAERGDCDFRRATAFAIDEFLGVPRATSGTNSYFFRQYLRVPFKALHIPNPAATDAEEHISAFAGAVRRAGGMDLCVLGIGTNGHVAFNEPGSPAGSPARVVDLTPESRAAHAAPFGSLDAVPSRGLTLGIADLLEARAILVLATGAAKAPAVARAIDQPPSPDTPASWLQSHASVMWLIDEAAAARLDRQHGSEAQ